MYKGFIIIIHKKIIITILLLLDSKQGFGFNSGIGQDGFRFAAVKTDTQISGGLREQKFFAYSQDMTSRVGRGLGSMSSLLRNSG